jgi:DNA-binding LacI/PurR family transcriptional regulator
LPTATKERLLSIEGREEIRMKSRSAQGARTPPLYAQVAEKIKAEIKLRKLRHHDPVPSEGEWAKLYSVSRMTAKLALDILAKENWVYRLARRGTFAGAGCEAFAGEGETPALPPAAPTVRAKPKIAMVFPNMDDYTARILEAAQKEARQSNCHVLICITSDREDESVCLQELYEDRIDGIILYPRGRTRCSEKVLELNLQNYPLVIIDRIFREVQIDCVYHDHYKGTYELTDYLIGLGHTQIGYLSASFDGVTSREDRYKGYSQAMLDHRLPIDGSNILLDCSEAYMNNLSDVNAQVEAFLRNSNLTAVVCMDDYLATSCLYTALQMNLSVPEDLSIVGFLDIQLSSLLPIPLTTARQTTEQLGQAAVQLLLKRIKKSREGAITVKVNTSIVERSSVRTVR